MMGLLSAVDFTGLLLREDYHQSLIRHINWLSSDLKKSLMKFIQYKNMLVTNSEMPHPLNKKKILLHSSLQEAGGRDKEWVFSYKAFA